MPEEQQEWVTVSVGGMLELLPASLAPFTTLPFARDKVTSLFTAAEALPLHHPHTAPFYSQGRVTLAAISQAWEEPTRSSRKLQPALLCTISKESLHGIALSIHQGWFWGLNEVEGKLSSLRQFLSTQNVE